LDATQVRVFKSIAETEDFKKEYGGVEGEEGSYKGQRRLLSVSNGHVSTEDTAL